MQHPQGQIDFRRLGFGAGRVVDVGVHNPPSFTTLVTLMERDAGQRVIRLVTSVGDGGPKTTIWLHANQMVVVSREGARTVADGVYKFEATDEMNAAGIRVTGRFVGIATGDADEFEPRTPDEVCVYFELDAEAAGSPATRLWIQYLTTPPQEPGGSHEAEVQHWHSMGFGAGWVHPLYPIGNLGPFQFAALLARAGEDGELAPPTHPLVLTTDDMEHRPALERCSVAVQIHEAHRSTAAGVTGYTFTGELIGFVVGSAVVRSVPPLDYPVTVRGFVEHAADRQHPVIWFQVVGPTPHTERERREFVTGDIASSPLASQLR